MGWFENSNEESAYNQVCPRLPSTDAALGARGSLLVLDRR